MQPELAEASAARASRAARRTKMVMNLAMRTPTEQRNKENEIEPTDSTVGNSDHLMRKQSCPAECRGAAARRFQQKTNVLVA